MGHHGRHGTAGGVHPRCGVAQLLAQDRQGIRIGQRLCRIMGLATEQGCKLFEHLRSLLYERCS